MSERIQVYGADWCHDTQDTVRHLRELGVEYSFHDVDSDPRALEWVKEKNGGKRKLPTVEVGGEVLSVPGSEELDRVLREKGLHS